MAASIDAPGHRRRVQPETLPEYATPSSSHSTITPSLSTSNSNSNSSGSPPLPVTPVSRAGRSQSRYADLGRVPLHRRGKSRTYERMEDLLREAGYKETRVFTPESERLERRAEQTRAEDSPHRSLRGVGSVVDFLTGLIPGTPSLSRSSSARDTPKSRNDEMPSHPDSLALRPHHSPSASPSSIECAGPTPRASYHSPKHLQQQHRHSETNLYQYSNNSHSSIHSHRRLKNVGPIASRKPTSESIIHPQPSRAGAYLRHMASVASIPPRPSSTPSRQLNLNSDDDDIVPQRQQRNGEPPPLPKTWLETVARAVIYGGVGYIGGPQQPQQADKRGRTNLRPPDLIAVSRQRSQRSEGEVSRTRVVCHSAPSSRPSSRSRDRGDSRERPKDLSRSVVPSLARTKVEGDDWDRPKPKHRPPKGKKRRVGGWGGDGDSSTADEFSEDDDGELDLAKILVPPKRQNSIRSLRKHLADVDGESSRRPGMGWDGYSEQPWDWKRREPARRGSVEEDENPPAEPAFFAHEGTKTRRRGLPVVWAS